MLWYDDTRYDIYNDLPLTSIIVATIDIKDKQVFFRMDGGKDYKERKHNQKFIVNYSPKIQDKISFSHWLLNINQKELPKTIN